MEYVRLSVQSFCMKLMNNWSEVILHFPAKSNAEKETGNCTDKIKNSWKPTFALAGMGLSTCGTGEMHLFQTPECKNLNCANNQHVSPTAARRWQP